MKTSEFRIGNIVEWNKKPFTILSIFDYAVQNELWCKPINEIHPIPLTEEILLKHGFEKSSDIFYDEHNWIMIRFIGNGLFFYQKGEYDICKLQYLHQLQNLFFILTGQELEIKL